MRSIVLIVTAAFGLLGAGPLALERDASFYVGGQDVAIKDGDIMDGAMLPNPVGSDFRNVATRSIHP